MEIFTFLIVGLIAGYIASLIVEGHGLGTLGDLIVGVIGSFVGGYIFSMMDVQTYGFIGLVAMALVGAVIFLFVVGLFSGRQRLQRH